MARQLFPALHPAIAPGLSALGAAALGEGVGFDPNAVLREFSAILAAGAADASIAILGTSIGNASTEWARLLDPYWAAFASNYLVRHAHYYDTGSVYGSKLLGQGENAKLTGATLGASRFADTFDRADGAIGTSSGGQSYGTVTSYSISSNKAVQTTFSNQLNPASGLPNDKHVVELDFTFGSNAGDGARLYELFTSTSACVFFSVGRNGVITLLYQPGAVTLVDVDTGADFANGETVHMKLVVDGDWLEGRLTRSGVDWPITAILSSAQKTALTGSKFAASMLTNSTGAAFDNLSVADLARTRRLKVWNASIPGATLANHVSKIANTIGSAVVGTLDMVLIEPMSHNAGTDSPATFLSGLDSLIAAVVGQQPTAKIGLLMENPQASPSTTIAEHAARIAALPGYAAANGFGLIDAFNGFDTADLVSDGLGIHPNGTGSAFVTALAAEGFGID